MTVKRIRDEFLARTGFPRDQHGRVRLGKTSDCPEDFLHGLRLTEDLRCRFAHLGGRLLPHAFFDGAPDQIHRMIDVERLRQILERATLKRGDGALEITPS